MNSHPVNPLGDPSPFDAIIAWIKRYRVLFAAAAVIGAFLIGVGRFEEKAHSEELAVTELKKHQEDTRHALEDAQERLRHDIVHRLDDISEGQRYINQRIDSTNQRIDSNQDIIRHMSADVAVVCLSVKGRGCNTVH